MLKIAAIVIMALASVSFGAVKLVAPDVVPAAADGTFAVPLALEITGGEQVLGLSLFGVSSAGTGTVKVTTLGRVLPTGDTDPGVIISDWTVSQTAIKNKFIGGALDMGGSVADVSDPATWITLGGPLMTLNLQVPVTSQIPLTITWKAAYTNADQNPVAMADAVTLVPEPISALLLAVGAAFFARRRVA
jgi:hypothetical protein